MLLKILDTQKASLLYNPVLKDNMGTIEAFVEKIKQENKDIPECIYNNPAKIFLIYLLEYFK